MLMTMKTKLLAALGALVLLAQLMFGVYVYGKHEGKTLERAEWQAKDLARKDAEAALVRAHAEYVAALHLQFEATNRKVSEDHEQELSDLRTAAAADRALVERAGGLRIPRAVCDRPAAATETASAGGRHEAAAATVRLPPAVENGLWALADAADAVTAQARACQAWIRENGFYGQVMVSKTSLQGKIVSATNQQPEGPHD